MVNVPLDNEGVFDVCSKRLDISFHTRISHITTLLISTFVSASYYNLLMKQTSFSSLLSHTIFFSRLMNV